MEPNKDGGTTSGAPGLTRTADLLVRSQTLYPTELRARNDYYNNPFCSCHDFSFAIQPQAPAAPFDSVAKQGRRPNSHAPEVTHGNQVEIFPDIGAPQHQRSARQSHRQADE